MLPPSSCASRRLCLPGAAPAVGLGGGPRCLPGAGASFPGRRRTIGPLPPSEGAAGAERRQRERSAALSAPRISATRLPAPTVAFRLFAGTVRVPGGSSVEGRGRETLPAGRGARGLGGRRAERRAGEAPRPPRRAHPRRCARRRRGASRRGWRGSRAAGTRGGGGVPCRAEPCGAAGRVSLRRGGLGLRGGEAREDGAAAVQQWGAVMRAADGPALGGIALLSSFPAAPCCPRRPGPATPSAEVPAGRGRVGSPRPPGLSAEGSRCRPVKVCGEPPPGSRTSARSLQFPASSASGSPRGWHPALSRDPEPGGRLGPGRGAAGHGYSWGPGTCPSLCPMLLFQARAGKR